MEGNLPLGCFTIDEFRAAGLERTEEGGNAEKLQQVHPSIRRLIIRPLEFITHFFIYDGGRTYICVRVACRSGWFIDRTSPNYGRPSGNKFGPYSEQRVERKRATKIVGALELSKGNR